MKKILFFACLFATLSIGGVIAQGKQNEKLVFIGSYKMGGLMSQFAQVEIDSKMIKTSKNSYRHLSLTINTFEKWDNFFKIRDLYESYVNPVTLVPSLYKRNVLEGNYRISEKYVFGKGKISTTISKYNGTPRTNTLNIGNSTSDIVSVFYKLRSLNFEKLSKGQIISYKIVFDEKEHTFSVRYLGKEVLQNAGSLGKKECYKLSIVSQADILKGKDKNLAWFTADANKTPVLIQFSIPVGVGQGVLKSVTYY